MNLRQNACDNSQFYANIGEYSEPVNTEFGDANISIVVLNIFNELDVSSLPFFFFFTKPS